MRSSIGDGLGTKIVRQMLSSIGDGLGTKIVFVIFGNCYAREDCSGCARRLATKIVVVKCYSRRFCLAREDCSGLVTKMVLVDWRRIGRLATSKILNKLILNKLLHVHYVKSVDSLTAITGFAWFYDRTH